MMKAQIESHREGGSDDLDADALQQLSETTNGYAVFGNKPFLNQRPGSIDDSDSNAVTVRANLKQLNGFYTNKNQFIPAAAMSREQDLIEKLRVHRSRSPRAQFDYEHSASKESLKHSFDEYCYPPHGNSASKLLSNNGGKATPCFDMMQLNGKLTLPPLLR
jgi:hypothetical protein